MRSFCAAPACKPTRPITLLASQRLTCQGPCAAGLLAEHDHYAPCFHADVVVNGVPDQAKISHRIVANAGHFSFLSPFPEAMSSPAFPPSQDPSGFDRARFHEALNAEVLAFLALELQGPAMMVAS